MRTFEVNDLRTTEEAVEEEIKIGLKKEERKWRTGIKKIATGVRCRGPNWTQINQMGWTTRILYMSATPSVIGFSVPHQS